MRKQTAHASAREAADKAWQEVWEKAYGRDRSTYWHSSQEEKDRVSAECFKAFTDTYDKVYEERMVSHV